MSSFLFRSKGELEVDVCDEISVESNFSHSEVQKLYTIFHAIDEDRSGVITRDELLSLPQLAYNPLASRVIDASFRAKEKLTEALKENNAALERDLGSAKDLIAAIRGGGGDGSGSGGDAPASGLGFRDFVRALAPFAPKASGETSFVSPSTCMTLMATASWASAI